MPKRLSSVSPFGLLLPLIAVIVAGSALLDYFLPPMGDDLSKWATLGLDNYTHPDRSTISFLAGHYFGCNGRVLDALGPAFINLLPSVIASAVMGLMAGLYFVMLVKCSGFLKPGRTTAAYTLILVTLATMPWYGAMYLRVCQFNYLWGTTFCLLTIYLFFKETPPARGFRHKFLLLSCAMIAAFSHEQNGVAMCAVMVPVSWLMYRRHRLNGRRMTLLIGLIIGTFITIASPAIWHRAETLGPDSTLGKLIITTLPIVILLLLTIVVLAMGRRGRSFLWDLMNSSWSVYVCVAIVSSLIAIYSTTPGRTGWLPESMAIVAFAIMLSRASIKTSRHLTTAICIICFGIIAWHFAESVRWQKKLGEEYRHTVELFRLSPTGTIFHDITPYTAAPPITLWRVKGTPDADDSYLKNVIETTYGPGKRLTVIPEAFHDRLPMDADSIVSGQYTIYRDRPSCKVFYDMVGNELLLTSDGRVMSQFFLPDSSLYYLAAPLVIDPGDNWHPVNP